MKMLMQKKHMIQEYSNIEEKKDEESNSVVGLTIEGHEVLQPTAATTGGASHSNN